MIECRSSAPAIAFSFPQATFSWLTSVFILTVLQDKFLINPSRTLLPSSEAHCCPITPLQGSSS